VNLYGFVKNNSITMSDYLGLAGCERNMVFDPATTAAGGWQVVAWDLQETGANEGDGIGDYQGVNVTWEASVAVYCQCSCPGIKHGTRVYQKNITVQFWVQKAGEGPFDIPSPITLIEAIGEVAARTIETNMPKNASMANIYVYLIKTAIQSAHPTKPTDGYWKGGISPCGK
jgi:hypothetical protein